MALHGMPGIMESALHVSSCEEMCLEFVFKFSNMISSLILSGNEFQRFGS